MRISPRIHPLAFKYLTTKGFAPSGSTASVDLPEIGPILENLISDSNDDYLYMLVPILLDTVRSFYPHDDAQVTLNNFIRDRYPRVSSEARSCLIGYVFYPKLGWCLSPIFYLNLF